MNQNTEADNNPWPLYIIVGMVAFVLISGYLLSPRSEEGKLAWVNLLGTTNNGILLNPPMEVKTGQIIDSDGVSWQALDDSTWKLLVVTDSVCGDQCQQRLDELHAMRIRLNRDANRLTIGLLSNQTQNLPVEITEFHDLNLTRFADNELLLSLQDTNMPALTEGPAVLLMNPIDVFMMAYGQQHTGVDMLTDFEHLLDLAH